ncbi:hypothetical protein [uncultured Rikenella sp.]|uniref:hypothetical protein n=1 Tax=uncultured Rikenella sp. TaxID=368003 RepID=UPI0026044B67|nr:hypothetical protein [uncultured Rikenella sp.]
MDGAPGNTGSSGYNWSSTTISGIDGVDLNFNVIYLNPQMQDARAHGFQLRCLSE